MIMDQGARHWLLKTVRAEFWRVSGWCDLEDLIQDGHMIYAKLSRRYPDANASHRMTLFKTSVANYLHDLAEKRSRSVDLYPGNIALGSLSDEAGGRAIGAQPEASTFAVLVATAPAPVKAVLSLLASDAKLRVRGGEKVNDRLCRLTGLNSAEIDLVGMLKAHFAVSIR